MTTSPNKMSDEEMEKVLFDFAKHISYNQMVANGRIKSLYQMSDEGVIDIKKYVGSIMHLIKQHREAYALELIGDDEESPRPAMFDDFRARYARNKLRAELREKIKQEKE